MMLLPGAERFGFGRSDLKIERGREPVVTPCCALPCGVPSPVEVEVSG